MVARRRYQPGRRKRLPWTFADQRIVYVAGSQVSPQEMTRNTGPGVQYQRHGSAPWKEAAKLDQAARFLSATYWMTPALYGMITPPRLA